MTRKTILFKQFSCFYMCQAFVLKLDKLGCANVVIIWASHTLLVLFISESRPWFLLIPGASCSKLMMSLVKDSLKFQMAMQRILTFFQQKNNNVYCKGFSHFFNKKITVYLLLKSIYS